MLKAKIHLRIRFAIQNIVGLILCEVFTKMLANIGRPGMALDREIASFERIKEIKSYWELLTESIGMIPQYCLCLLLHEQIEGYFQQHPTAFQYDALFGSDHLERPCIVWHILL